MSDLTQNGYSETAASFAAAGTCSLPEAVREKGKIHLVGSPEAGVAGKRYAQSLASGGVAAILGAALRTPLAEAVLANGIAAHADETDDSHESGRSYPRAIGSLEIDKTTIIDRLD